MATWIEGYTERERKLIAASRNYKEQFADTGLPGHNLMLIIGMLAEHLDPLSPPAPAEGAAPPPDPPAPDRPFIAATKAQLNALYAIASAKRGWSREETDTQFQFMYK